MKSKSLSERAVHLMLLSWMLLLLISCNSYENEKFSTGDSTIIAIDTTTLINVDTLVNVDTSVTKINRNPPGITEEKAARGYAIVYCPTKMISNVPSIVNATISKEEFAKAYAKFSEKIQGENVGVQKEKINRDIKGDSIDIFERMGVKLEFDSDDFKQISKSEDQAKEFKNKNSLEWEWIIKPIHSTPKSIINFKFYYLDPDNKENFILEKTISISASVDARSFTDKWADFLAEDAKTTITVIVVPFLTFLGGFFSGRKKNAG